MKKIAIFLLAVLFAWAVAQPAEAGHGRAGAFLLGLGLGALILPPLLHPAPVVIREPHDPPPPPPEYGRYGGPPPDRVWVPGHWERRWDGYDRVWERIWIPGHWSF